MRDFTHADAQIDEVEPIHVERLEIFFNEAAQVGGRALIGPVGPEDRADLGGNDEIRWIRMEGFADEDVCLNAAILAAVEVGSIDMVDTKLHGAAQNGTAGVRVTRRSLEALGGKAHGTKSQTVDAEIAAKLERGLGVFFDRSRHVLQSFWFVLERVRVFAHEDAPQVEQCVRICHHCR